jgi:FkbM family methyltransferase
MNSQNDEERIIKRYFKDRLGTFLDIGANDGKTLSNSYALAEAGWDGVCIEPSPQAFARLSALYADRPDIELVNCAIGTTSGKMQLHEGGEHLGLGDVALLSTLLESETTKWLRDGNTFSPVWVEVKTLAEVLKPLQIFDLVTIDAEGMDMDILQQMDLDALGVLMLIIEHEHGDARAMQEYCEAFGMSLVKKTRQNLIMAK